jgi:subtilisin family serine protease
VGLLMGTALGMISGMDQPTPAGPPARPFEQCTGKGVRIAVIDSGVNPTHPHINGVAGGTAIGGEIDSYLDLLGHGTAVLAAIKEKAPDAEYYAVKVYYRSLRTNMDSLAQAFRWSINQQVDVINLSLGSVNSAHEPHMMALLRLAEESGTAVVAAAEIESAPAFPGSLPGVIGVSVDWECPRDRFRFDTSQLTPRWRASGYPRSLPGVHPLRNLYGVSFAVANMSGFVARACELAKGQPGVTVNQILHQEAQPFELAPLAAKGDGTSE